MSTVCRILVSLTTLAALLSMRAPSAVAQPVSAFAGNVGARGASGETPSAVVLYMVPEGRTLLLTDVLIANHGQEAGPLYLADSQRTRCSIELLQNTLLNNGPGVFSTLSNVHTTLSTGIPFGSGEPVLATLVGGSRGVDVTITGTLVRGARRPPVRIPGGARDEPSDEGVRDRPER